MNPYIKAILEILNVFFCFFVLVLALPFAAVSFVFFFCKVSWAIGDHLADQLTEKARGYK